MFNIIQSAHICNPFQKLTSSVLQINSNAYLLCELGGNVAHLWAKLLFIELIPQEQQSQFINAPAIHSTDLDPHLLLQICMW